MADKIVNQLPIVLQTKAIKNFFEATVEQLYSQANTVPLAGFIGKKTGEKLLAKMKEGVGSLRDRINKKFEKDDKADKVKEILETEHKDKVEKKEN